MKKTIFTGAGVAIVTPFDDDDKNFLTGERRVNFEQLGDRLEFQVKSGTDAIIVCGTTGESSTMTEQEKMDVIKFTIDKINGRIPVIVGTGCNDTLRTARMSEFAESAGASGVLVMPPYYNKTTQIGLYKHIEMVARSIKIPIILYNIPSRTGGLGFSIDTLKKLDKIENVTAIKEASGDIVFAAQVARETELDIYSGNDDVLLPILSLGGKGVISVVGNIVPIEVRNICKNYFSGDTSAARSEFLRLLEFIKTLFIEVNPIPIKTAMNLAGMPVGNLRMPLCDMAPENLEKLKAVMKSLELRTNF